MVEMLNDNTDTLWLRKEAVVKVKLGSRWEDYMYACLHISLFLALVSFLLSSDFLLFLPLLLSTFSLS